MNTKVSLIKRVSVVLLFAGLLLAATPFAVGMLLDKLRLDPFFWCRFEFSREFRNSANLDAAGFHRSTIEWSFSKGNSGVFGDVKLRVAGHVVEELGGDENIFFAFRDVDGDGTNEFLFTTTGSFGSGRTVCKWVNGSWKKVPANAKSGKVLQLAELMFYGPLVAALGFVTFLIGAIAVRDRDRTR